jgi:hypothetical protein
MAKSVQELKARVEQADLWPESTNDDRCDTAASIRKSGANSRYSHSGAT